MGTNRGTPNAWQPDEEIAAALQAANGVISVAARALGQAPTSLKNKIERTPVLVAALEDARNSGRQAQQPSFERSWVAPPEEVSREEILEAENRELRAALAKDRKGSVAAARIQAAIELALDRYEPPPFRPVYAEDGDGGAHHAQLLQLSDFHGGEDVNPEVINYRNDYSWDIMERRVDELLAACVSHQRHSPPVRELVVTFGGDMCSGSNHLELAVTNEFPLAEQGVRVGYLQARIVRALAEHYPTVRVYGIEGNHPRLSQKPSAKDPHNNMDWVANVLAKECVKDVPNVTYTIGRGSQTFEVAGRTCYLLHGDGIRSSMPGVPWGGVMRRMNTIQASATSRIHHFLVHHFHQANVVQSGRIMMNGALKGTDEYVEKSFGGGDAPTQLLHLFDEKRERYVGTDLITPTAGIP